VVENAFGTAAASTTATTSGSASATSSEVGGTAASHPPARGGAGREASMLAKCVHYDGTETLSLVRFRCVLVVVCDFRCPAPRYNLT
jgi:hypothetical protein